MIIWKYKLHNVNEKGKIKRQIAESCNTTEKRKTQLLNINNIL
jgi:hypothetical protein